MLFAPTVLVFNVSKFQGFNISVSIQDACFMRCALVSKFHRFAVSRDGIMVCTPTAQCCFEMLKMTDKCAF